VLGRAGAIAEGVYLARDLINTPANDLGPAELAEAARRLAERHGAACDEIVGDDLIARNYPAVHAVGQASARAPRLIDLARGDPGAPKVTLVGKGVCFDSGGLDIKPADAMLTMKKDMGGAAIMLGLAHAVMALDLPVRLRLRTDPLSVQRHHRGVRIFPVDPRRCHIDDGVEHDAKPVPAGQLHQPVDVVKIEFIFGGMIPPPLYPVLHRVESQCGHVLVITLPVLRPRGRSTVIL
jgi:hypothetical protein